jgi:predicted nucleic acid-binding protein
MSLSLFKHSFPCRHDTNTIVRYLVADDPALHEKAKEFFDKVKHGGFKAVILESVIAECMYVLTKIRDVMLSYQPSRKTGKG